MRIGFLFALAFGLGIVADRYWLVFQGVESVQVDIRNTHATGRKDPALSGPLFEGSSASNRSEIPEVFPEPLLSSRTPPVGAVKSTEAQGPAVTQIERFSEQDLKIPLEADKSTRVIPTPSLDSLLSDALPAGNITSRKQSPDGLTGTAEALSDGSTVLRSFAPTGELLGERWATSAGETIERTFHDSGRIKGLSWNLSDGTLIQIKLSSAGLPEGRSDQLPNGDKIFYKYDSAGRLTARWIIQAS